jgi:RNA polymerase sigma-70 factor (ECF subfamily)
MFFHPKDQTMSEPGESDGSAETAGNIAERIGALHQEMLRFAQLQLRDPHLAEDVTQDAITAALNSGDYAGRAQLKTWVFAILRNKIIDIIRDRSRHPTISLEQDEDDLDQPFKANGHWKKDQRPSDWHNPEASLANDQFWVIFEACLNDLPENPARVFMMREHLGLEVREICAELAISESNCWVLMHRARMRLRKCLEVNFIQREHIR